MAKLTMVIKILIFIKIYCKEKMKTNKSRSLFDLIK